MTQPRLYAAPNRIPSLDGLRALSILLVIVGHAYRTKFHEGPHSPFWLMTGNASLGVSIFFVISGYLITTLVLKENDRWGKISLRNFYVRRVFRIFPACYCYVAVVAMLGLFGALRITSVDVLSALTFTWNYSPHAKLWAMEHLWSLSVEEQFYLLWPTTLVLLLRYSQRSRAIQLAGFLVLAAPFSRLLTHAAASSFYAGHIQYLLHTRMDSLMFGCFCALAEGSEWFERAYNRLARMVWIFPAFAFVISPVLRSGLEGHYLFTVGYTLEGLSIALTMMWLVRNRDSLCGKVLNSHAFVFVGLLSYSLYVWQQFFLNPNSFWREHLSIKVAAAFGCAVVSYYVIEQPFLRWRKRFEQSLGTANRESGSTSFARVPKAEEIAVAS